MESSGLVSAMKTNGTRDILIKKNNYFDEANFFSTLFKIKIVFGSDINYFKRSSIHLTISRVNSLKLHYQKMENN